LESFLLLLELVPWGSMVEMRFASKPSWRLIALIFVLHECLAKTGFREDFWMWRPGPERLFSFLPAPLLRRHMFCSPSFPHIFGEPIPAFGCQAAFAFLRAFRGTMRSPPGLFAIDLAFSEFFVAGDASLAIPSTPCRASSARSIAAF
jgi:hypothetical protein